MILTPHMLVGAAIGAKIHNFWLVFLLSIFSHYLTDRFWHWDYAPYNLNREGKINFLISSIFIVIDSAVGLALVLWLFDSSPFLLYGLAGMFGGILPDLPLLLFRFLPENIWLKKYRAFHHKNHLSPKKNPPIWLGVLVESLIAALAIAIILI